MNPTEDMGGEVLNLTSAKEVLARAQIGQADMEEVVEKILTLEQLQRDKINNPDLQATLAALRAVRGVMEASQ